MKDSKFEAEVDCCHLNVWVKFQIDQGEAVYGWNLFQDKLTGCAEAIFHTVWKSPDGKLIDLTPRADGERLFTFVVDKSRHIILTEYEGMLAIQSFSNVAMLGNKIVNEIEEILIVPQTDMIQKYNLVQYK